MALFFSASNSVFGRVEIVSDQMAVDEVAHAILNSLVFSSGTPTDWQLHSISDVNSFGLATSANVLDTNKVVTLINSLNNESEYLSTKTKLGIGPYEFYLRIIDRSGVEVIGGGNLAVDPEMKLIYERIVLYNSTPVVLQAIVSLEVL